MRVSRVRLGPLQYWGSSQVKSSDIRTHSGHAAHAAELGEVLLGGLVLFVLVDPLVEIGLEELELLGLLEQTGPVLVVELLLAQLELDVPGGVVDLAVLRVDLGVKLKLDVIVALQSVGVTIEGQGGGLQVELEALLGYIGDGDSEIDEVLLRIGAGGALGPEDYLGYVRGGDRGREEGVGESLFG